MQAARWSTTSSRKTVSMILMRHGESIWNHENRFTGWVDVPLTSYGQKQAQGAGKAILQHPKARNFDIAFASVLSRSIKTLWLILEETNKMFIPQSCHWRLNERHYGALQGKNKEEAARSMDKEMVHKWRRTWDAIPPTMGPEHPHWTLDEARYIGIPDLPRTESLECTWKRLLPFWNSELLPVCLGGRFPLVVAHGNSLRAILASIEGLNAQEVIDLHIPTGVPILYELNAETLIPLGQKNSIGIRGEVLHVPE
eukprot:gb/GECG01010263.1/.p1 GENE.gb/GECG01010263.1/~~gb/GECG01010263.1/.p1  ORF type:complete len:255 (+),score=24.25 gb/GECG01010263.1/:1-765(+)